MRAWGSGAWGNVAGRIGGAGILVGIAAGGAALAVVGVGLLWLAVTWFMGVVLR